MQPKPLLILVSGKPGSGKSTLARQLAAEDALWLPLVSCDPLRNGMLETGVDAAGRAAIDVFYGTIEYLLNRGVSLIAELSFWRGLDEPQLSPLTERSRMVNIHCETTIEEARRRFFERQRSRRPTAGVGRVMTAMVEGRFDWAVFEPLDLAIPRLCVGTTDDYLPALATIADFCRSAANDAEGG